LQSWPEQQWDAGTGRQAGQVHSGQDPAEVARPLLEPPTSKCLLPGPIFYLLLQVHEKVLFLVILIFLKGFLQIFL
jgi:hypothetical protein